MKSAVVYDKWLSGLGGGEVVACAIARLLKDNGYRVSVISGEPVEKHKIKDKLGIDFDDIPITVVWNNEEQIRDLTKGADLFINTSFMDYSVGHAKKNFYYVHFPTLRRGLLYNQALKTLSAFPLHRLIKSKLKNRIEDRLRAGVFFDIDKRIKKYGVVLVNSQYTASWTKRLWERDVQIVYPPVGLLSPVGEKKQWIASVGRFFTLGHGKKQEILIQTFKKMCDEGLAPGWELHLVGGVGNEPSSVRFVEELRASATGYPVVFHLNCSRGEVESVLRESALYWHATGYGEDPLKNPIRFEHFGIALVEALSAGCVPVVFDGGGLPEILDCAGLASEPHVFRTTSELQTKTARLIAHPATLPVDLQAKLESTFSVGRFKKQLLRIIKD